MKLLHFIDAFEAKTELYPETANAVVLLDSEQKRHDQFDFYSGRMTKRNARCLITDNGNEILFRHVETLDDAYKLSGYSATDLYMPLFNHDKVEINLWCRGLLRSVHGVPITLVETTEAN